MMKICSISRGQWAVWGGQSPQCMRRHYWGYCCKGRLAIDCESPWTLWAGVWTSINCQECSSLSIKWDGSHDPVCTFFAPGSSTEVNCKGWVWRRGRKMAFSLVLLRDETWLLLVSVFNKAPLTLLLQGKSSERVCGSSERMSERVSNNWLIIWLYCGGWEVPRQRLQRSWGSLVSGIKALVVRAPPPFWGQRAIFLGSLDPDSTPEHLVFSVWAFDIHWSQKDLLFVAVRMLLLIYVLLSLGSMGYLFSAIILVVHLAGNPFS